MDTVNWATKHVPFYKNRGKINSFSELMKFPIITKEDYRAKAREFITPLERKYALSANTGGSTGIRMDFFLHRGRSRPKERAHFDWYWGLFGYSRYSRTLVVRGKPLQNRRLFEHQTFENRLTVSCHDITESNVSVVIDAIRKFRPEFILAYPSALLVFTKLFGDTSAFGPETRIKVIFFGSEILSESDRSWFAEFYGTQVVSWYGHSECVLHGGYLPGSNEYHFFPFYGYCELLDENDNEITEAGRVGRIVGTSFDNYVMPFIRYDTGDLGVLSANSPSSCGFPVLERIEGRGRDIVYLSDGRGVSMTSFLFAHRMTQFAKIRDMQLEQNAPGELLIRMVKGPGFSENEDEREIVSRLTDSVCGRIRISVVYVDSIAKTPNGKQVLFIQKIDTSDADTEKP
jgi:phenylacetate-CoA ligase